MADIPVHIYESFVEYSNKQESQTAQSPRTLMLDKGDIKRLACEMGAPNGSVLSKEGQTFYHAMVDMALETPQGTTTHFVKRGDYENAESSFKGVISFLLGMAFTRAVALDLYSVDFLFHLKDPDLQPVFMSGNAHPDYIALGGSEGVVGLFEAKGDSSNSRNKDAVRKGVRQIENVQLIEFFGSMNDTLKGYTGSAHASKVVWPQYGHVVSTRYPSSRLALDDVKCKPNLDSNSPHGTIGQNTARFSEGYLAIDLNLAAFGYYRRFAPVFRALIGDRRPSPNVAFHNNSPITAGGYFWAEHDGLAIGIDENVAHLVARKITLQRTCASHQNLTVSSELDNRILLSSSCSDDSIVAGLSTILERQLSAVNVFIESMTQRSTNMPNGVLKALRNATTVLDSSRIPEKTNNLAIDERELLASTISDAIADANRCLDDIAKANEQNSELARTAREIRAATNNLQKQYQRFDLFDFYDSLTEAIAAKELREREKAIANSLIANRKPNTTSIRVYKDGTAVCELE